MKREYRQTFLPGNGTGPNQVVYVCTGCGASVVDRSAHNQFHWRIEPRRELMNGDEVYIRPWLEEDESGRTVHQKAYVTGKDESIVRIDRSGRTYYFEYEDVFPADPAYGFDPYWKEGS